MHKMMMSLQLVIKAISSRYFTAFIPMPSSTLPRRPLTNREEVAHNEAGANAHSVTHEQYIIAKLFIPV